MVLEKLIYQMETLMKENILMEKDMDRLEICHIILVPVLEARSPVH